MLTPRTLLLALLGTAVLAGALVANGGPPDRAWHVTDSLMPGHEYGRGVAIDSTGSVILAGYGQQAVGTNGFARKFDRNGAVVWTQFIDNTTTLGAPSASADAIYALCVDRQDNVILTGALSGTWPTPEGYHSAIVVQKYAPDGVLLWQKLYDGGPWGTGYAVTTDADDNVYVAGTTFGNWNSEEGLWVILKYDAAGFLQSGFPITYNYKAMSWRQDVCYGVAVDRDGSIVAVGVRAESGVSGGIMDDYDWHVRKYDDTGALLWDDTWDSGGKLHDFAKDVVIDGADGSIYVCGYSNGGPDNTTNRDWDTLVVKYSSDGVRQWTRILDESPVAYKHEVTETILLDSGGTVHIGGYFWDGDGERKGWTAGLDPVAGSVYGESLVDTPAQLAYSASAVRGSFLAMGGWVKGATHEDWHVALFVAKAGVDLPKFSGKLNFKKPQKDSFLFKGTLVLSADFEPEGATLTIAAGGVEKAYTLDAKGKAKTLTGKVKLKYSKKKGTWKIQVKEKSGDFAAAWADEGVVNETVKDVPVTFVTTITVGLDVCECETDHFYKGKLDKAGKVK